MTERDGRRKVLPGGKRTPTPALSLHDGEGPIDPPTPMSDVFSFERLVPTLQSLQASSPAHSALPVLGSALQAKICAKITQSPIAQP
jgi:hypothetical protein